MKQPYRHPRRSYHGPTERERVFRLPNETLKVCTRWCVKEPAQASIGWDYQLGRQFVGLIGTFEHRPDDRCLCMAGNNERNPRRRIDHGRGHHTPHQGCVSIVGRHPLNMRLKADRVGE
jgi:hypothetical protein